MVGKVAGGGGHCRRPRTRKTARIHWTKSAARVIKKTNKNSEIWSAQSVTLSVCMTVCLCIYYYMRRVGAAYYYPKKKKKRSALLLCLPIICCFVIIVRIIDIF